MLKTLGALLRSTPAAAPAPGFFLADSPVARARLEKGAGACGVPLSEARVAVLVGSEAVALWPSLAAQSLALEHVLLIAPGEALGALAHAPSHPALANATTLRLPDDASTGASLERELTFDLWEFFQEIAVAPRTALLVDLADTTAAARAASQAAQDLCVGLCARYFATLDEADVVPHAFKAIADFLFAAGDHYTALKFYWPLYQVEADAKVAWRILACWSELGCAEWVELWLYQSAFTDDVREKVRAEVAPALERDRADRAVLFERNRSALRARAPHVAARLAGNHGLAQVLLPDVPCLFRMRKGSAGPAPLGRAPYELLLRTDGLVLREVNPPPAWPDCQRLFHDLLDPDQPHLGVVGLVEHAWAAQVFFGIKDTGGKPGWQRCLFLLEPDSAAATALFETVDLTELLASPRVRLFLGEASSSEFLTLLRRQGNLPPPGVFAGDPSALKPELQNLWRVRTEMTLTFKARFDAQRGATIVAEIIEAVRGRQTRPLRIFFFTSIYTTVLQFAAEDLATGFRALGHECLVLKEFEPGTRNGLPEVCAGLVDFQADVLVLLDHTRAEVADFLPTSIPVVTWVQDELPELKDPALCKRLGARDFTYAHNTIVQTDLRRCGHPFVGHLPFAVNPQHFANLGQAARRDEVVFATNVDEQADPAGRRGLCVALEQVLAALPAIPLDQRLEPLLDQALSTLGGPPPSPSERRALDYWAFQVARRQDRLRAADAILQTDLPLCLYGNGWNTIERFRAHHAGVVAPGDAMRAVYAGHKVVLHINRGCNVHPRLLEGYLAGAFVAARHDESDDRPGETRDQFVLGDELVLFHDEAEMAALIRRALSDETWRSQRVERARARILRSHTFTARAQVILDDLGQRLAALSP